MTVQPLTPPQHRQFLQLIDRHNRIRRLLPAPDVADLDRLTVRLRHELFSAPLHGNVLVSASRAMARLVPALSQAESTALADFALGGIAAMAGGSALGIGALGVAAQELLLNATKQMQEAQMSFNLQYLQLLPQMQPEHRSYAAISNVMKTKHDTVKNSISNVR